MRELEVIAVIGGWFFMLFHLGAQNLYYAVNFLAGTVVMMILIIIAAFLKK